MWRQSHSWELDDNVEVHITIIWVRIRMQKKNKKKENKFAFECGSQALAMSAAAPNILEDIKRV